MFIIIDFHMHMFIIIDFHMHGAKDGLTVTRIPKVENRKLRTGRADCDGPPQRQLPPLKINCACPLKAGSLALGMHGCQLEPVSSQYLETARSSVHNALNHSTQNTGATSSPW